MKPESSHPLNEKGQREKPTKYYDNYHPILFPAGEILSLKGKTAIYLEVLLSTTENTPLLDEAARELLRKNQNESPEILNRRLDMAKRSLTEKLAASGIPYSLAECFYQITPNESVRASYLLHHQDLENSHFEQVMKDIHPKKFQQLSILQQACIILQQFASDEIPMSRQELVNVMSKLHPEWSQEKAHHNVGSAMNSLKLKGIPVITLKEGRNVFNYIDEKNGESIDYKDDFLKDPHTFRLIIQNEGATDEDERYSFEPIADNDTAIPKVITPVSEERKYKGPIIHSSPVYEIRGLHEMQIEIPGKGKTSTLRFATEEKELFSRILGSSTPYKRENLEIAMTGTLLNAFNGIGGLENVIKSLNEKLATWRIQIQIDDEGNVVVNPYNQKSAQELKPIDTNNRNLEYHEERKRRNPRHKNLKL
jgi:hypothetical protein